jgi:hypothetical protein
MNWFRQNPFWGAFIAISGGGLLLALGLLWWTKSSFEEASASYREAATQQTQLESSNPYPSQANVSKMKTYLDDYKAALDKLKADLKTQMLAEAPLAPNEFQTHLRQAITAVAENARSHRVKLPANFNLGFDEFVSTLPSAEEAPALGQELAQIQLLLNTIIEARVDAITVFHRIPQSAAAAVSAPTPASAAATPPRGAQKPAAVPKLIQQRSVEVSLSASPSAGRKVINQISSANDQFFIVRAVYVKNQKDKGPSRDNPAGTVVAVPTVPAPAPAAAAASPSATPIGPLNFIVGNEHIDLSARVELVNFRL